MANKGVPNHKRKPFPSWGGGEVGGHPPPSRTEWACWDCRQGETTLLFNAKNRGENFYCDNRRKGGFTTAENRGIMGKAEGSTLGPQLEFLGRSVVSKGGKEFDHCHARMMFMGRGDLSVRGENII